MKTKILASVALLTLATAGSLTYAASTPTGSQVLKNTLTGMHVTGSGGFNMRHEDGRGMGEFEMMGK